MSLATRTFFFGDTLTFDISLGQEVGVEAQFIDLFLVSHEANQNISSLYCSVESHISLFWMKNKTLFF